MSGTIQKCTWELCGLRYSYWGYRPSKPTNIAFAVLFAISTVIYLAQGVFVGKRWLGFTIAMTMGCALEVVGYVGRVLAYEDLWSENPFLIQIVCLTIAPAFLAAGIYLCLSRIVVTLGSSASRIPPLAYPRIFIPCDVLSLVLQAIGGGIASVKTHLGEDPALGNHIMIAGLAVQVFTLFIFILLALDFAVRTVRGRGAADRTETAADARYARVRASWLFRGFLIALSLATLLIFTRCVYRVAELSEGWNGHLIKVQSYFVGLEGAVIIGAVFLLNMFHPGLCFKDAVEVKKTKRNVSGTRRWFGKKRSEETGVVEEIVTVEK